MDIINKLNDPKLLRQILPELTVKQLEKVITLAANSYYNTDISLISDETYDILVEKLKKMKPTSDVLNKIGAPLSGKKVKSPYWLGSMNKIKEEKQINNWLNKYRGPYVISEKLDGISCLLTVNNGKVRLYSRGDGLYCKDITHLIDYVNMSIDTLYQLDNYVAIRGELVITKKKFDKYANSASNARSLVSGIVNSKPETLKTKIAQDIDFVCHELIEPKLKPLYQMETLKDWDLNVVKYKIYDYVDIDFLESFLLKRKIRSIYEIDGLIITDNRIHVRNTTGNPAYSFAYKGSNKSAQVKVLEVIWTPSKDGILVPRIHFEKVRLSGADLEFTAGFNANFIEKNKIGKGTTLLIVRSGEVVPYIVDIIKPAKSPDMPTNYNYQWDETHVNIYLKNVDNNQMVIIKRLTKFVKDIGVENLSIGIITKLVNAGYDSIMKIIKLSYQDLLQIEGFQQKLAEKIYNNLQQALKNIDILRLMVSTNIFGRGYGEKKIQKILDAYPNIVEKYNKKDYNMWYQNLLELEGFDSITVNGFLEMLPEFIKFYKKIKTIINVKPYKKKVIRNKGLFTGETVVFTGFRNKGWESFIENEGGHIGNTISKNVNLLIYNDGDESTVKYQKAIKLGINTIAKSKFAKKYNL